MNGPDSLVRARELLAIADEAYDGQSFERTLALATAHVACARAAVEVDSYLAISGSEDSLKLNQRARAWRVALK